MHSLKTLALLALTATLSTGSAALAAPSSWDMAAGDQGTYTYNSGQSVNGNFGSASAFSEGFFFIPTGLKATATANLATAQAVNVVPLSNAQSTSDTLSVILNAKANQHFTKISSSLLGDFTIDGLGEVNSTGTLRVTNLDTHLTLTSPLAFGDTVPVNSIAGDSDGIFQGSTALSLPQGWTNIRVEMGGMVSTEAFTGSSLIQGKDAELGVSTAGNGTAEIPIPAAAAVAPVAAFFAWRAKRKLVTAR